MVAEFIVEMAKIGLRQAPFLFGIGTIENAYERVAKVKAVSAEEIIETERILLQESKANMPKLLLQPIDILVVDQMGKEFSGSGMDPNITGKAPNPWFVTTGPQPGKLIVLDLSDSSHGNAAGIGNADITTRRLFNKIDFNSTYVNVLTATALRGARIPVLMDSDRLAIRAAIKTCNVADLDRIRLVRIANTLHIDEILISECMLDDAEQHPDLTIAGAPEDMPFDPDGNLLNIGGWQEK